MSCGPEGTRIYVELPAEMHPGTSAARRKPVKAARSREDPPASGTGGPAARCPARTARRGQSTRASTRARRTPRPTGWSWRPRGRPTWRRRRTPPPRRPRPTPRPARPRGSTWPWASSAAGSWTRRRGNGAADSVNGLNNGTVSGAARVEGGFPNARYANPGSLRFDGDNDFVELGTRNMPPNNQRQSVTFWVNIAAMPTNNRVCFSLTSGRDGGSRLKIGFKDDRVTAWKGGDDDLVSAPAVAPGWHHYAYTYDGTTHRLFLDGVQRGTSTTAPDTGAVGNARIGAIFNNAENFQGQIDEVRVYNRPITAAEVAALQDGFQ